MNFLTYCKAGYSLLWVETTEENRCISELSTIAKGYTCYQWNIVSGMVSCNGDNKIECDSPIDALQTIESLPEKTIVFCMDFHKFFEDIITIRTCKSIMPDLQARDKHIIFVSHTLAIPDQLKKDITVFDFELPSIDALMASAQQIVTDNGLSIAIDQKTIVAAKGLTQQEAENAFARSLIESKTYDRAILENEKLQVIKKSGLMEIWPATDRTLLGGLDNLKQYIDNRQAGFYSDSLPTPKGILLTGIPGTGKSLASKTIASVLNMPLIRLDLGTLKGSLVGESEANMRKAFQLIDAVSPCVVWIDEIEKSLSGTQSSGKTDGGTSSNMFGQLLTWLQESTEQHYIVATCNDIESLLSLSQGALIRRFDDIFFVDIPSENEIKEILSIMFKKYRVESTETLQIDTKRLNGYTGAEIEKIVKNSLYDGIETALKNVKPIAQQNKAVIDKARQWAKNNAIMANGETEMVTGRKLNV